MLLCSFPLKWMWGLWQWILVLDWQYLSCWDSCTTLWGHLLPTELNGQPPTIRKGHAPPPWQKLLSSSHPAACTNSSWPPSHGNQHRPLEHHLSGLPCSLDRREKKLNDGRSFRSIAWVCSAWAISHSCIWMSHRKWMDWTQSCFVSLGTNIFWDQLVQKQTFQHLFLHNTVIWIPQRQAALLLQSSLLTHPLGVLFSQGF